MMMDVLLYEPKSVSLVLLLLLSFVLPFSASRVNSERAVQLAWTGQSLLAIAGICVLFAPKYAYLAVAGACAGCGLFVYLLAQMGDRKAGAGQEG